MEKRFVSVLCETCQQPFQRYARTSKGRGRYCSRACFHKKLKDLSGQRFFRLLLVKRLDADYYLCRCDCGTEKPMLATYFAPSQIGKTKSCGCMKAERIGALVQTESHREKMRRPKNGKGAKGQPRLSLRKPKICKHCQSVFFKDVIGKPKNGGKYFCSRSCMWAYYRDNPKEHPQYNGYTPHRGPNWEEQRVAVRKRANYTCEACGINEGNRTTARKYEVHHIIPFRMFGIEQYKQANDLDNLILLCVRCHHLVECGRLAILPRSLRIVVSR